MKAARGDMGERVTTERSPAATSRRRARTGAGALAMLALVSLLVPALTASPAQAAASFGSVTVAAYGIANPQEIVTGSDGNLWFANTSNNSIGRITPAGVVTAFVDPSIDGPAAITSGPDGNLWFTNSRGGSIARITTSGAVTDFTDPTISGVTDITSGPDGALWFTNRSSNSIGRITTAGAVTKFVDPSITTPMGITSGPDGNLWFTEVFGVAGAIGRITPAGVVTAFPDFGIQNAFGITAGPDGNLWFVDFSPSRVGRITTAGVITMFTDAAISSPFAITAGPDGNVWFTNGADRTGNTWLAKIAPSGAVTKFPATGLSDPRGITSGPDGNLWFTDAGAGFVGRVTPAGVMTRMSGPTIQNPVSITTGPDANLWFLNADNATIGRITPSGAVTAFPVGATGTLSDITSGPDGNLWFTDVDCGFPACAPGHHDSIGRITPAGVVTTFTDYRLFTPSDITAGPDGNLWFTNSGGNSIGRITPSGIVSTFTGPGLDYPFGITAGPDGNLWFTNLGGSSIGNITPTGTVTNFSNPGIDRPREITAGGDGSLWFTNTGNGAVGRITTTGAVVTYSGAGIDSPYAITSDAAGNVWFTNGAGSIGRLMTTGAVSVAIVTDDGIHGPYAITDGPDGNVWFTNAYLGGAAAIGYVGTGLAGPPTGVTASAAIGSVTVSWTPPSSDGGAPVTSYTVTSSPGNASCTWTTGPTSCTVSGLTNGLTYRFRVVAHNANGQGLASAPATATPTRPTRFHPVVPGRVLDSRPGPTNIGPFTTPWNPGPGGIRTVPIAGKANVPIGADAVVLNVTAVSPSAGSFVQLWATGAPQPTYGSSLNFTAGQIVPNAVTVELGTNGSVSIFNAVGNVDLVIDVSGYYSDEPGGDGFTAVQPDRVLDSRAGPTNIGPFTSPWSPGPTGVRDVPIRGLAGVPAEAEAVVLNVTVVGPTAGSFLQLWPTGSPQPPFGSNLNFTAGQIVPNAVTVKLGTDGKVSIFNAVGHVDVVIDVAGYYAPGTGRAFHALVPGRVLDSRPGPTNIGPFSSPWNPGLPGIRDLAVGGQVGVPVDASGVVMNVTSVDGSMGSFVQLWPTGSPRPTFGSNLNFAPHQIVPNAVTVKLGTGGQLRVYNDQGQVHLVADVAGYFD